MTSTDPPRNDTNFFLTIEPPSPKVFAVIKNLKNLDESQTFATTVCKNARDAYWDEEFEASVL